MPAIQPPHPSAEDVSAFALGQLDGEALAAVEGHLAGCPSCQARAAATPDDRLIGLIRSSRIRVEAPPGGETLSEAVLQTVPAQPFTTTETATLPPRPSPDADAATTEDDLPEELARHERYRVTRLLGKGGMGAVYEAEHRFMQRRVALKVINRAYTVRPASVERFRREVRAAARLSHPNIVTAYDAENAGQTHFLVMEYIAGTTLGQLVRNGGPLPVAEACDYIRQAALGLQHAHERGMVHRDIKPDNLILASDGRVKVLDFGLAALAADREAGAGLTEADVVMGTPEFMAPEQADDARAADVRADIYSLGCTLYFLLTGAAPYPAATPILKLLAHRDRPVPSVRAVRPEVPEELSGIVERMLAKKPANRYQTPGEVAAALEAFVAGRRKPPAAPKRLALAALLFAALALVAAAAAVYRIATDTGELVITTESDDVEVVIKQGGKVVRVIDVKTDKQVVLTLRSGVYELELPGAHAGLRLTLENATLRRGEKELAKIERVPSTPPTPAPDKVGEVRQLVGHAQCITSVAFSPNGRLVLTAAGIFGEVRGACDVQLWNVATGEEVRHLEGLQAAISKAAFSVDGKRIVATSYHVDPRIFVWNAKSGMELRRFISPHGLYSVAFTPNGERVFSGAEDGTISLWEIETGKRVKQFKAHDSPARCLAVSRDGRYLVSGGCQKDTRIRVWEVASGKEVRQFVGHAVEGQTSVTFSPDSSRILSSGDDGTVRLWDIPTGKEVRRFEGHSRVVCGAAFSPDGQRILSAGSDRTVRLWDTGTGKELHRFSGHTGAVHCVAFSPDGRFAVSGSADNTARLWRLPDPPARGKP